MFSVFSQINRHLKPSKRLIMLKECVGSEYERLLLTGPEDEPLYMLKPEVQPFLCWINNKILYRLPFETKPTINVRLRIATSMLNNLEKNNILSKEICILYHKRLIENVNKLQTLISLEDLPF